VTEVIVNQSLLGVLDRALDRLQLLSELQTRPALLDHLDDGVKVAIGTLETLDDRGMTAVWHLLFPSRGEDSGDPPEGIEVRRRDFDATPMKIPAILRGGYTKMLDSLGCEALVAKIRPTIATIVWR
jgi:hypothetical protein